MMSLGGEPPSTFNAQRDNPLDAWALQPRPFHVDLELQMLPRIAALLSIPPIVATILGLSYALWLSRAVQEALLDPSHLPITCEPSSGSPSVILSAGESERVYRSRCDFPDTAAVAEWAPTQEVVVDLEPL